MCANTTQQSSASSGLMSKPRRFVRVLTGKKAAKSEENRQTGGKREDFLAVIKKISTGKFNSSRTQTLGTLGAFDEITLRVFLVGDTLISCYSKKQGYDGNLRFCDPGWPKSVQPSQMRV